MFKFAAIVLVMLASVVVSYYGVVTYLFLELAYGWVMHVLAGVVGVGIGVVIWSTGR